MIKYKQFGKIIIHHEKRQLNCFSLSSIKNYKKKLHSALKFGHKQAFQQTVRVT
jgi:ribosomal protein S20